MLYKHFTEKLLGLQGIEIENIEEIEIPSKVTGMGSGGFMECKHLTKVDLSKVTCMKDLEMHIKK